MVSALPCQAISRRAFIARFAGMTIGIAFLPRLGMAAPRKAGFSPSAWVTIDPDGLVTIQSAPAEVGQGIMTGLPACLAEDMDADWNLVRIVQSPGVPTIFGNPSLRMEQNTRSSAAMAGYYSKMRLIGAQTRQVLLINAARTLNVPVSELSTTPGKVHHTRSGATLGFGAIAATARLPTPLPNIDISALKPLSACRFIGKSLPRVDLPAKVAGTAMYGVDVRFSGMLYAAVLYPPTPHDTPTHVDASATLKIEGVVKVVTVDRWVGVIATTVEASKAAQAALKVSWAQNAPGRAYDTDAAKPAYRAIALNAARPGVAMAKSGDAVAAIADATSTLQRVFLNDHVAHVQMEPLNATARLNDDGTCEVWLPTQSPSATLRDCARALDVAPERIVVHSVFSGGAFGRTSDDCDYGATAALLARAVPGRPVKLLWKREDDLSNDKFRPLAAQAITVGFDKAGAIVGWHHRLVSPSHFARYNLPLYQELGGEDFVSGYGMDVAYEWPNHLGEFIREESGWDVGPWREVASGYAKFGIEGVLDEIAAMRGVDPIDYRLGLLTQHPRGQAVLRAVAEMSGWRTGRQQGRALGVAFSLSLKTYAAQVAEISIDTHTGVIKVDAIWVAVDAGLAVQPDAVVAQLEGSMIMGISAALYEQATVAAGVLQQTNFDSYTPIRMRQVPATIAVSVISTDNPPTGVSEIGISTVAPAIAGAVAHITGKRLRDLPMLPARVKAALAA